MEEDHKAVIQNNFGKLLEDFDPKAIMRYLFEKKVITSENVDTIKSQKSRLSKGDELLHILMRSGPDAFPQFIAGLRETDKPWLALMLLEEGEYIIRMISCRAVCGYHDTSQRKKGIIRGHRWRGNEETITANIRE